MHVCGCLYVLGVRLVSLCVCVCVCVRVRALVRPYDKLVNNKCMHHSREPRTMIVASVCVTFFAWSPTQIPNIGIHCTKQAGACALATDS